MKLKFRISMALSFNRPNNLEYTKYTEYCVSRLTENGQRHLDNLIGLYTTLQRTAEEASFKSLNDRSANSRMDQDTLEYRVESLKERADTLFGAQPTTIQEIRTF
jgi:hypothetical protein